MEKTRQRIPGGLAEMPPGPDLAAVLSGIDVTRLSGLDCVTVLRARHRQANHEQAKLMAAMVEVALCGIGPDDQLPRMDAPDEFSADEIRGALAWTRRAADNQLSLAWDLINRLPNVFAELDAGSIDVPKTKVFSEWTDGLTDEQARQVCDHLLPEAPVLTTGQLAERIKKLAIAIDPSWARHRYEQAIRDRKVVGYRNEDGSANLCGYGLPVDRAAAACAHIDALAKKVKHAGDGRPTDHIKADLYLAMLDGSYTGWSEHAIITHMLAEANTEPTDHNDNPTGGNPAEHPHPNRTHAGNDGAGNDHAGNDHAGNDHAGNDHAGNDRAGNDVAGNDGVSGGSAGHNGAGRGSAGYGGAGYGGAGCEGGGLGVVRGFCRSGGLDRGRGQRRGGEQDREEGPGRSPGDGGPESNGASDGVVRGSGPVGTPIDHPVPFVRRAGVEVRVEITTLLGLNDRPAEIAGWGPVHAEAARKLVTEQTAAEWRYAVTDDDGRLLHEGITRWRPGGYPSRAKSPSRGGIVELQIKLCDLRRLAPRPARLGGWAKVIADLVRQINPLAHELNQDIQRHDDPHTVRLRSARGRREDAPVGAGAASTDEPRRRIGGHGARPGDRSPAAGSDRWTSRLPGYQGGNEPAERCRGRGSSPGDQPEGRRNGLDSSGPGDRTSEGETGGAERGGRRPSVSLRRRTQIRDRTCVHPGCRAPASSADGDHTRDWADLGATTDGNIGSLCRHDHRLKHEGGWRVRQPQPGHFVWISRLGVHHRVRPPLIIEPLLDPVPRDQRAYWSTSGVDPPDHDSPTWWDAEPARLECPPAGLCPITKDAIPPF